LLPLFATVLAAFLLSWAAGKANLSAITASLAAPDQIFRGGEFSLGVTLSNRGRLPALGLRLACRGQRVLAEHLSPGGEAGLELRYLLPHRGLNRVEDLRLESDFPFGFLRHSRPLEPSELTALPQTREVRSASELRGGVEVLISSSSRRSRSGDLWGVREMRSDEDVSSVNWKLSAKVGRLMAVEYAEAAGSRVTVRLEGSAAGPDGEARVEEAAGACRFFIDSGAEVRLLTPDGEVDYGRGLLHLDRLLRSLALAGDGATSRPSAHPDPAPSGGRQDEILWRRLLLLGCWLVYLSLFLVEEFRTYPAGLLAALLAAGVIAQERSLPRLPARAWDAATLAVLLHAVFIHWRQAGIMVANSWLVAYMLVYCAFNPADQASRRRALIVFYLGFFLVSGQTISFWYFPAYLAFLAFSTAWLAGEWGAGLRPGRGWPRVLGTVMASLLVLAALAFAVIPRIEPLRSNSPIVASLGLDKLRARSSAVMGFTKNVSLGYFGELRRSSARVMRVRPLASPGAYPPPLYVRGMAFDSFDGLRWSKEGRDLRYKLNGRLYWSRDGSGPLTRAGKQLFFPNPHGAPSVNAVEYTVYPMSLAVIFSAYPINSVEQEKNSAFFDYTDSAYFATPYLGGANYIVRGRSGAPAEGTLALAEEAGELLRLHLRTPAGEDPRIAALAKSITRDRPGDLEKARAVEKYLRTTYSYSLFSKGEGSGLSDFLFVTREGNCEYFASAAAVLLRHAGIPTRLVTGFYAAEFNEYGGFYDVRQNQAHAWVEARIDGLGWVRLEATPSASSGSFWGREFAGRMSRWIEAGNVRWYRHVIGYDTYSQRNTFHRLEVAVSRWNIARTLAWLAAAAGAVFILRTLVLAWPRRRTQNAAQDIFSKAQAALESAGLKREPAWTPREYAAQVAQKRPDLSGFAKLAEQHYLERYAGQPRTEAELAAAQLILKDLRSRLTPKLWRR
jgi:transglutaminase-like putative cysteine protease